MQAPSRKKTNAFEILASARDACVAAFGKTKSNVFNIEGTSRELPGEQFTIGMQMGLGSNGAGGHRWPALRMSCVHALMVRISASSNLLI